MMVMITGCTRPPAGWRCTREKYHNGPCAALPAAECVAVSDFIPLETTVGRMMLPRWRRVLLDFLCRQTGHLLWRIYGSRLDNPEGSLPLNVTICRRCGLGGYVKGDYWRDVSREVKQNIMDDLKRAKLS